MTPYERACKNAVDVQNACNFSGVLFSFAEDIRAVIDHLRETGAYSTPAVAVHPVCVLYMDKLRDLQGRPGFEEFSAAHEACERVGAGAGAGEEATCCP